MWEYIKNLFENGVMVAISAIWGVISSFIFPERTLLTAAAAVLIIMLVDLITKLFALAKRAGGIKKAIKSRTISSHKFSKGTMDKLIVFGIMLVISGCAYRICPIAELATWFTQLIFTLMFLRDVLSIIENLGDAGVSGLGPFKKKIKAKYEEVCGDTTDDNLGG